MERPDTLFNKEIDDASTAFYEMFQRIFKLIYIFLIDLSFMVIHY